jgi:hypothetical protein
MYGEILPPDNNTPQTHAISVPADARLEYNLRMAEMKSNRQDKWLKFAYFCLIALWSAAGTKQLRPPAAPTNATSNIARTAKPARGQTRKAPSHEREVQISGLTVCYGHKRLTCQPYLGQAFDADMISQQGLSLYANYAGAIPKQTTVEAQWDGRRSPRYVLHYEEYSLFVPLDGIVGVGTHEIGLIINGRPKTAIEISIVNTTGTVARLPRTEQPAGINTETIDQDLDTIKF